MIPQFPEFAPIDTNFKEEFDDFNSNRQPYSDYNFTSLVSWNTDGTSEVALLNDNMILKIPDYITGEHIFSINGDIKIDSTLMNLKEHGVEELKLVPESTVECIDNPDGLKILEDRDNHDYVYNLAQLTEMEGASYKKKRHQINRIRSHFGDRLDIKTFSSIDEITTTGVRSIFDEWSQNSSQTAKELEPESKAIENLIQYAAELSIQLTLVSIDDAPVAFSVNELLGNGFGICHFEKAKPVQADIQSLVAYEAARALYSSGCKFVNWEQDLGIAGIRHAKNSFRPSHFLKKYSLKLT